MCWVTTGWRIGQHCWRICSFDDNAPVPVKSTTFFLVVNHIPYVNGSICIKHRGSTVQYVHLAKWFTTGRESRSAQHVDRRHWGPSANIIHCHSFLSPSRSPSNGLYTSAVLLGCALSVEPAIIFVRRSLLTLPLFFFCSFFFPI